MGLIASGLVVIVVERKDGPGVLNRLQEADVTVSRIGEIIHKSKEITPAVPQGIRNLPFYEQLTKILYVCTLKG